MALHSLVEVALHFESFRNVDLFHQGLYHLKACLYRENGDERQMAIAYGHSTIPTLEPEDARGRPSRMDHHNLVPGCIAEELETPTLSSFSTRSFLIRYCEEEVEINDIGLFRFELTPELLTQESSPLTLEVDLMFADLAHYGGAENFQETALDSIQFKSVSSQVYRLHGAEHGLHEYCPVVFDEFHCCIANLCIHSALLDVRFRLRPQMPVPPCPRITKSDSKAVQREDSKNDVVVKAASQNGALSLTECMFGSCRGTGREQLLLATEAFYQSHLKVLAKSYAGLAAWHKRVIQTCLTDGARQALGDLVAEPEPQLTGCGLLYLPQNGSLQHWLNDNGAAASHHSPSFKSYLTSQLSLNADEKDFARHVALDMNVASCQILGLWHNMLNLMLHSCREIACLLRKPWEKQMSLQWNGFIERQPIQHNIMAPTVDLDETEPVLQPLNILQQAKKNSRGTLTIVEDVNMCAELQPMLFEQRYSARKSASKQRLGDVVDAGLIPSAPKDYRGVHLFVLVHGFQGNSFDMRLFKNNLALVYPDAVFMVSSCNEDSTDGDLQEMGIRLAQEVVNFISDWCPGSSLGRLSFVGYSIGGVIVRSALPYLKEYHDKFYTFLSLSVAHFGFMDQQSPLFNSAVWMLTKWKKCTLLEQLSLRDAPDLKDTYLAKLCKTKGLEHFKWIALVSSKQDNYSPSKSSRMEMDPAWEKSASKDVYAGMVRSLWEDIQPERVLRIRAHFNLPEKNVDAMIGRVAHIRFIECQPIMRMLIHNYSFLFR